MSAFALYTIGLLGYCVLALSCFLPLLDIIRVTAFFRGVVCLRGYFILQPRYIMLTLHHISVMLTLQS
ncbi:MAG: hypothetical protein AB1765_08795 [Candidatus Hydrogenedentota bacterium]